MDRQRDPALNSFRIGIEALRPRIRKIVLFGSRARRDHSTHSDYDLMIVVDRRDRDLVDRLYDAAVSTMCEHAVDISLKILSEDELARRQRLHSRFIENVMREGVPVE